MTIAMRIDRRLLAGCAAIGLICAQVGAQTPGPDGSAQPAPAAAQLSPEQYDQMLAPIALYPDPLLGQILAASTYPLEVVEADRWLQDPANASLGGDQLTAALAAEPWDPSVKSLAPFPQVLHMMDEDIGWTEQLGDAFLANQAAVMDSVQRLRQRAQSAGTLQSTPQEVVTNEDQDIEIAPPDSGDVYVPVYDPNVVYGPWPYLDYPPYYFPGFFAGVVVGGLGIGWFGYGINHPLWGWDRWDWRHHRLLVDAGRFNAIDPRRAAATGSQWQHDPAHRGGVPYRDAATRERYAGGAQAAEAARAARGYASGGTLSVYSTPRAAPRAAAPEGSAYRQSAAPVERAPVERAMPPTIESYGRGSDVRMQSERGQASRMSMPAGGGWHGGGGGGAAHAAPGGHR